MRKMRAVPAVSVRVVRAVLAVLGEHDAYPPFPDLPTPPRPVAPRGGPSGPRMPCLPSVWTFLMATVSVSLHMLIMLTDLLHLHHVRDLCPSAYNILTIVNRFWYTNWWSIVLFIKSIILYLSSMFKLRQIDCSFLLLTCLYLPK